MSSCSLFQTQGTHARGRFWHIDAIEKCGDLFDVVIASREGNCYSGIANNRGNHKLQKMEIVLLDCGFQCSVKKLYITTTR